jgi:hypothetical protein
MKDSKRELYFLGEVYVPHLRLGALQPQARKFLWTIFRSLIFPKIQSGRVQRLDSYFASDFVRN